MGFCPQLGGVGPCPAQCIWQSSGFAADQTNAMLAVVRADDESLVPPQAAGLALSVARPLPTETASLGFGESPAVGGDKSSRKRKSLRLLGTAGFMEGFAIYSRETRCFFCWLSRDFFSLHTALFRHSCVGVSLPSAYASCCRNAGRAGGNGGLIAPCRVLSPRRLCERTQRLTRRNTGRFHRLRHRQGR